MDVNDGKTRELFFKARPDVSQPHSAAADRQFQV